jgi:signal transduction histidine kinase
LRVDPAACALLADSSGRIWVRTPDGAALRESDGRVRDVTGGPLPTNPDRIFLGELPDGRIWTSTSSGPSAWDGHRWESILPMTGLAHYRLNATLVDQEGSLWLGSAGTLSRSLGGGSWMTYLQVSGLAHPAVFQIKRTRSGALWVGTEDGAARREGLDWKPSAATRGRRIISLAEAPDGTLWCGDNYGRITVITPTGALQRVYGAQDGLRGTGTRSILWDREGRPWLGHIHGGVTRGVLTGGRWRFEPVDLPGGTPDEDIRVIRQGAGDELLIASSQGLVRRSGSTWRRFGTQEGLRDRTIMDLAHMPDGRYAICYFQPLGLDLFRFQEGALALDAHYEEGGGLGSSKLYSLALDDRGRLWMGTGAGAAMLEGTKLQSFTEEEGLVHDDCMQGALLSEAQGVMWVGTAGGLSRYAPPFAPAALPRPRTLVRGMKVEDGPRSLASGGLRLGAKERSLTLALTGLTYRYDRLRQVEVRMDGLESNWSQLEAGEARYPYLPPGAYTFRARSRIAGGEWGPELTVPIRVVPAWWQHAAFRTALALAALMAVGLAVKLRLRSLEARNAELDQRVRRAVVEIRAQNGELVRLNEAKNRVLAAAAHDVRNPLGAILLYLDLLEEEPEQRETSIPKIRRITHDTLDLLNSLLEFSRVEAGNLSVELSSVDPEEVVAQVLETETPSAQRKGLRLHVERREEVAPVLADRLRLKEILNNLVDNAIKFSATIPPGREIRLILGRGWIAVQDQGPGFSEEDLGKVFAPFTRLSARPTGGESSTGLGLSIVKGMVEAMGGSLGLESVQGEGATFTVRLPPAS